MRHGRDPYRSGRPPRATPHRRASRRGLPHQGAERQAPARREAGRRLHRRARRLPRRAALLTAAAGIAVALAIVVCATAPPPKLEPAGHGSAAGINTTGTQRAVPCDGETVPVAQAPQSTPRDEWRRGSMPYLYQVDPQYKDVPYSNGTFEVQGCGPTALAMVYIDLTGDTSMGPAEMADFSTRNGYSTDGNGSSWLLMSEGAERLGLASATIASTPQAMSAELAAGHPVICIMGPGAFTKVGHYIAIEGLDEGGKAIVHDSNSRARSLGRWDLSAICAEAEAAWSFSVA